MNIDFLIAVKAILYLVDQKHFVNSDEIASHIHYNPVMIRKVMTKLKKARLITARMGADGGYKLNMELADINLYQIMLSVDDESLIRVTNRRNKVDDKTDNIETSLYKLCKDLNDQCNQRLNSISLEQFIRLEREGM